MTQEFCLHWWTIVLYRLMVNCADQNSIRVLTKLWWIRLQCFWPMRKVSPSTLQRPYSETSGLISRRGSSRFYSTRDLRLNGIQRQPYDPMFHIQSRDAHISSCDCCVWGSRAWKIKRSFNRPITGTLQLNSTEVINIGDIALHSQSDHGTRIISSATQC